MHQWAVEKLFSVSCAAHCLGTATYVNEAAKAYRLIGMA